MSRNFPFAAIVFFAFYLILPFSGKSQDPKFLLGMFSCDFDNITSGFYPSIPYDADTGLDYHYLKSLKDLNFNTVVVDKQLMNLVNIPATSLPDLGFMDRAQELELDLILGMPEIKQDDYCYPNNPADDTFAFNYYGAKPALIGYHLSDEPHGDEFEYIGEAFDAVHQLNPGKIGYTDLYPIYASYAQLFNIPPGEDHHSCESPGMPVFQNPPPQSWNWVDIYRYYLQAYIDRCHPDFLLADNYPFGSLDFSLHVVGETYDLNLWALAKESEENSLRFMLDINTYMTDPAQSGWNYFIGKDDINIWNHNYYSLLMYGCKGIILWRRELHGGSDFRGLFDLGTHFPVSPTGPTSGVDEATRNHIGNLNQMIEDHQDVLMDLHFEDAYHLSDYNTANPSRPQQLPPFGCNPCANNEDRWWRLPWSINLGMFNSNGLMHLDMANDRNPISPIDTFSTEKIALSVLHDSNNQVYFFVFNKSVTASDTANFFLDFNGSKDIDDVFSNMSYSGQSSIPVKLNPGQGKLFRVSATVSSDSPKDNDKHFSVFPVPFNDYLQFHSKSRPPELVEILDLKGDVVASFFQPESDFLIDTEQLSPGIFVMKVYTVQEVFVKKVIKVNPD